MTPTPSSPSGWPRREAGAIASYDVVLLTGLALAFVGFAFKGTDRFGGLAQVIFQDAYERVGELLMRIGVGLAVAGSLIHLFVSGTR